MATQGTSSRRGRGTVPPRLPTGAARTLRRQNRVRASPTHRLGLTGVGGGFRVGSMMTTMSSVEGRPSHNRSRSWGVVVKRRPENWISPVTSVQVARCEARQATSIPRCSLNRLPVWCGGRLNDVQSFRHEPRGTCSTGLC